MLPKEFLQLSANAAESRQRTESLHSSGTSSDPLPMRISVGDRRLSDTTSRVHGGANGTQQLNGRCDLATEQGQAATESSPAVKTGQDSASSVNNPGLISDSCGPVNGINGQVNERTGSGEDETRSSQASRCSQLLDGSPTQSCVGSRHTNDFVLVAAGHENAVHTQQKRQRKDDKNKSTPQMHYSSYCAVAASRVEPPQSTADGRSADVGSVSAGRRAQTRSTSDSIRDGCISGQGPNCHSADVAVVTAAEVDDCHVHVVNQPSSNSCVDQEYDIILSVPSSGSTDTSLPLSICDTIAPLRSGHLSAVGGHDATSPANSDRSHSDVVTDDTVHQNRVDFGNPIPPANGIGRGQLLRMMLDSRQRLSNDG